MLLWTQIVFRELLVQVSEAHDEDSDKVEPQTHNVHVEHVVVALAHAVVNPVAVVVETVDASVARVTMPRVHCVVGLAVRTQTSRVFHLNQLHETYVFA
jgi:hypothetical protein